MITIDGRTYLTGKLNVQDQFHVFRRVMPFLTPILMSLKREKEGMSINKIALLAVLSGDLSTIPDEHLNYVIDKCLDVVEVDTGTDKPLKLRVNGQSMFGDMDLTTMIQIVWAVMMENFRPFLSGLLDGQLNVEATTPGT